MPYSLHLLRDKVGPLNAVLESSLSISGSSLQGLDVEFGNGIGVPSDFGVLEDSKNISSGPDSGTSVVWMVLF